MSPFEHGEVFVLNDGGEVRAGARRFAGPLRPQRGAPAPPLSPSPPHLPTRQADLDLGNYERFLDVTLTRDHNLTTGKVYSQVINAERRGDYLGKTVQVIPHVTDAIQDWLDRVAHLLVEAGDSAADVCLVEVGGTVGDIESLVFLEALRQFQFRVRWRGAKRWPIYPTPHPPPTPAPPLLTRPPPPRPSPPLHPLLRAGGRGELLLGARVVGACAGLRG